MTLDDHVFEKQNEKAEMDRNVEVSTCHEKR
jgi:hypothetical protein